MREVRTRLHTISNRLGSCEMYIQVNLKLGKVRNVHTRLYTIPHFRGNCEKYLFGSKYEGMRWEIEICADLS